MHDVLEEKLEQVVELKIQLSIDLIEYIESLKRELKCNESEAIMYLMDLGIDMLNETVEDDNIDKKHINTVKNILDIEENEF